MERKKLFKDDADHQEFLDRVEIVLGNTNTRCFAFALMPNHFHLLLQTGTDSISYTMHSLLTRYASYFNRKYNRSGKLYQNRFKSVLCDEEEYLQILTQYIHLNPVRGKIVRDIPALSTYPWTSFSTYMGKISYDWVTIDPILLNFGTRRKSARKKYSSYVQSGLYEKESLNLDGGGLVRSLGGKWEAIRAKRNGGSRIGDERILGDENFVQAILEAAEEQETKNRVLQREGWDFARVLALAAKVVVVADPKELMRRSRNNARAHGRALACKWLADDLGMKQIDIAKEFGMTRPPVTMLIHRGRLLELEMGIEFESVKVL